MTKAHNLSNYITEKYNCKQDSEDFCIYLYNLSDKEFDYAITDHYDDDDIGLHAEWD